MTRRSEVSAPAVLAERQRAHSLCLEMVLLRDAQVAAACCAGDPVEREIFTLAEGSRRDDVLRAVAAGLKTTVARVGGLWTRGPAPGTPIRTNGADPGGTHDLIARRECR